MGSIHAEDQKLLAIQASESLMLPAEQDFSSGSSDFPQICKG